MYAISCFIWMCYNGTWLYLHFVLFHNTDDTGVSGAQSLGPQAPENPFSSYEEFIMYFCGGPVKISLGPMEIHMVRVTDPLQKMSTKSPVAQVVGILLCGRQGSVYPAYSMPWLLMSWWLTEPGHQEPWCLPSYPGIFWFQHQKG